MKFTSCATDRLAVLQIAARRSADFIAAAIDMAPEMELTLANISNEAAKFLMRHPEPVISYLAAVGGVSAEEIRRRGLIKLAVAFSDELGDLVAMYGVVRLCEIIGAEVAPYRLPTSGPLNS